MIMNIEYELHHFSILKIYYELLHFPSSSVHTFVCMSFCLSVYVFWDMIINGIGRLAPLMWHYEVSVM